MPISLADRPNRPKSFVANDARKMKGRRLRRSFWSKQAPARKSKSARRPR